MASPGELQGLLDTSRPFDEAKVRILEQVVHSMLKATPQEMPLAHEVLSQLKAHPESWRVVGSILELSKDAHTRFFALSILEACINTRWNVLPQEQKDGVKQYVTDMAIVACTDPAMAEAKFFVTKINETLIQIVKHEWPAHWPTFIPDLCAAARTNQSICENSMRILSLLSEEVFDFGSDHMTSQKVKSLMMSLNDQFQTIYDLCMFVIQSSVTSGGSVSPGLITATLQCLAHFVKWVPFSYIFETGMIDLLLEYFWEPTQHRIDCVRCLTEIVSLKNIPPVGVEKLRSSLWTKLVQKLAHLPEATMEYDTKCHPHSRIFWETFYCQISICLTSMLKNHRVDVCEAVADGATTTIFVLDFLVKITSRISHEETFKICVDYWHHFSEALLMEVQANYRQRGMPKPSAPLLLGSDSSVGDHLTTEDPLENPAAYSERLRLYQPTLDAVRKALITRMARPQEVVIHYDEDTGTVDRDYETDTDEVSLYNIMREALIFLTNLGGEETQSVMMQLLQIFTKDAKNPNQRSWNPTVLSRLCWAIGSVSGAMSAQREQTFLVQIIRDLLWLCEHKRGKENKAVVASMIMYVFGQYPRFLKRFSRFLDTVVTKLFEFMKETFQGVQDMACETYLKISQKCAKALATPSSEMPVPMIEGIIPQLPSLYAGLQTPKQQLMLYEGAAHIIAASGTLEQRQAYLSQLMAPFNAEWGALMVDFAANPAADELYSQRIAKKLTETLRINERVAFAAGTGFSSQLMSIYSQTLQVYGLYSARISVEVASHGTTVMHHGSLKALRSVKRATLLLIQTFVDSAAQASGKQTAPEASSMTPNGTLGPSKENKPPADPLVRQQIVEFIIPPLLEPVLRDYKANVPLARDHEVLSLLGTLVTRLDMHISAELPKIFEFVFDSTLDMIKVDFHSFPDHRAKFYALLRACVDHCFEGIFTLPDRQQRHLIESLIWAFKHEQPAVAELGLTITQILLRRVSATSHSILLPFCQTFYWTILTEIFSVLTDTLHKSGFQYQALILMHLIQLIEFGRIEDAEFRITKPAVMSRLADLLIANFGNLNRKQVEAFVLGLFNHCGNPKDFSQHLRDFLVCLKEFAGGDELFEGERLAALQAAKEAEMQRKLQVPGMAPQYTAAEFTRPEDLE